MYAYLSDGRAAAERPCVARHLTAVLIDPPDRSWRSAAASVLTHVLTGAVSRTETSQGIAQICGGCVHAPQDPSPNDLLNPKQNTFGKSLKSVT